MSCCEAQSNGRAPSSALDLVALTRGETLWERDLGDEVPANVPVGAFTVDPAVWPANSWTGQVPAGTALYRFVAGVGLEYTNDGTAAAQFNGALATSTAAAIMLTIGAVFSVFNLDSRARLLWTVQYDVINLVANTQAASVGMYGRAADVNNGAIRYNDARRTMSGGVQVSQRFTNNAGVATTSSNYTSAPGQTADVLAVHAGPGSESGSLIGIAGQGPIDPATFGGANTPRVVTELSGCALTLMQASTIAQTNTFGPLMHPTTSLVIANPTTANVGHRTVARRVRLALLS